MMTTLTIITSTAAQLSEQWKNELSSRSTQVNEYYNPIYSFELEFGGIPISHIPVINDTTPKLLIKRDKQLVLRSVARQSAPSLFYYTLLNLVDVVPELITYFKEKSLNVGLIGDEMLSMQRFLQTYGVGDSGDSGVDGSTRIHEYKIPPADVSHDKKYTMVVDSNHKSTQLTQSTKTIAQNVLNTHNTRVVLSILTQNSPLMKGGIYITRLVSQSKVSESLITLLEKYFKSVKLLYTFNGDLFAVCIDFNADIPMPTIAPVFSYAPNIYVTQIDGISPATHKIINTVPSNITSTPTTKKEIITELKEKIDNSVEFLMRHNIDISIYYQPDQILSELQYFLDRD